MTKLEKYDSIVETEPASSDEDKNLINIKEKFLNIISLAMSINFSDSIGLSVSADFFTSVISIYVHKRVNGISQCVLDYRCFDGVLSSGSYLSYDNMISWLENIKREWSK